MYDRPSENGIEGGRVSKLDLIWRGASVARYDRGWDQQPRRPDDQAALRQLVEGFSTRSLVQISPEPTTRTEYWAAKAKENVGKEPRNSMKFFDKSRYQEQERDR